MKKIFLLGLLTWLLACQTDNQSELVNELNCNIIEVKTISPDSSLSDLNALDSILADKIIIGLGEATHGTHEFFKYKHRLIKYLVTRKNYNVFIIEGDFAGSQAMYDYVVHGNGTIGDGLMGIGIGVWFKQEFVDLIEWMKEYNIDKPLKDRIKIYGCDMQSGVSAAERIKDYLQNAKKLNSTLEDGLDWVTNQKYHKKLTKDDEKFKQQFLLELNYAFNEIIDKNSRKAEFMQHCKRELEQFFEYVFADLETKIVLRDKFMAENIGWIYSFENGQKSIFWAHNGHIKNDKDKSSQKPTGYYLKQEFNDKYYSFGLGFYKGEVQGYNQKEKIYDSFEVPLMSSKKLTDAVFSECVYPNFILDFKSVNENEIISGFLQDNLYQRTIGAGFYPGGAKRNHFRTGRLIDMYDGLVFFRNTNPSTLIIW